MSDAEGPYEEDAVLGEAEAQAQGQGAWGVAGGSEGETVAEDGGGGDDGEAAEEAEEENDEYPGVEEEVLGAPAVGRGPLVSGGLGEAPDLGEAAEIVVIGTSLGSIKRQFFSSKRVQHFLDYLKDTELFKEWRSQGLLRCVESPDGGEPEVELPQVLVDGVVLGGETDLQELEEDGDLDWVFARAACPCCLHEKPTEASSCASCGAVFTSLIPADVLAAGGVQQMLQGYVYNAAEEGAGSSAGERLKERWASGLQQADFEWEGDALESSDQAAPTAAIAAATPAGRAAAIAAATAAAAVRSFVVAGLIYAAVESSPSGATQAPLMMSRRPPLALPPGERFPSAGGGAPLRGRRGPG
ncbi:hypothetical protein ACSSS7_002591 [Eimeria intestinalis]